MTPMESSHEFLKTRSPDPLDLIAHEDTENPCPPLTDGEWDALVASLKDDGYIPAFPIVISSGPACEGQIIDGFHRTKACEMLGIEPVVIYHPCETETDFKILQIKSNLDRRQLSLNQKALLGLKLIPLYTKRAEERRKAGTILSIDSEVGMATELAAQAVGTSHATMARIKHVQDHTPDLLTKIASEQSTVWSAYTESIAREKEAEREIEEAYFTKSTGAAEITQARYAAEVVRMAMELDTYIRKHAVREEDVRALKTKPHTFKGCALRLQSFLENL